MGGHRVTMDRLRAEFAALGCTDVSTFIASGNVIFTAPDDAPDAVGIARHLQEQLGWPVPTYTRSDAEVIAAVELLPFGPVPDGHTHMVAFCATQPSDAIESFVSDRDSFQVHGADVHWLINGSLMDSQLALPKLAKLLGQPCTTRNMTGLRRMAAVLAHGPAA